MTHADRMGVLIRTLRRTGMRKHDVARLMERWLHPLQLERLFAMHDSRRFAEDAARRYGVRGPRASHASASQASGTIS